MTGTADTVDTAVDQIRAVGVIGLAPMGAALSRNIARTGRRVVVQNRTAERTRELVERHRDDGDLVGAESIEDLLRELRPPRTVILMVKAGGPVDAVLDELVPHLAAGDVVIDGGNAHERDTERRTASLVGRRIGYLGMGVSGGEDGALNGPSLMPGGDRWAYDRVQPLLADIAARADDGMPCEAYLGAGGAGHFVKMVHNGIEYADMAAIAEVVDLLRHSGHQADRIAAIVDEWNEDVLGSFLLEITSRVLRRGDDLATDDRPLLDAISDAAAQKGTGRWTAQEALELGEPATTIAEATMHRSLSSLLTRRQAARKARARGRSSGPHRYAADIALPDPDLVAHAADALLATRLVALAQGFELLAAAAEAHDWPDDLAAIATIWRAGCIIRSRVLDTVRPALAQYGPHLLAAPSIQELVAGADHGWRRTVAGAVADGVPVPVLSSALAWHDALVAERLPTALIQAQRDVFGAHTYERVDREGTFHTDW